MTRTHPAVALSLCLLLCGVVGVAGYQELSGRDLRGSILPGLGLGLGLLIALMAAQIFSHRLRSRLSNRLQAGSRWERRVRVLRSAADWAELLAYLLALVALWQHWPYASILLIFGVGLALGFVAGSLPDPAGTDSTDRPSVPRSPPA